MGLPVGTVTFLFSDIEGSTRLERELGTDAYARLIDAHDRLARAAIGEHGGHVVKTEGDALFAAFGDALAAVDARVGALGILAPVASAIGEPVVAARLVGVLDAIREETGLSLPSVDVLHMEEPGAAALAALGPEAYAVAHAAGAAMSRPETTALILSLAPRIEEGVHVAAEQE